MPPVSVEAWAKVNLYLHVTGKRPDGYHLLDSLVVFAGIGDTLRVEAADDLSLSVDGPTAALLDGMGGNIVLDAAQALARAAQIPALARIHLTKRLPVAAGIGGGSADAAATLLALSRLWGVTLPPAQLHALALALGADVPVCLRRRPTRMGGIGDTLAEVPPLPAAWLVLVNPRIGLSTPAVFKARQGCFSAPQPLESSPADAEQLAAMLAHRGNDLTDAAISLVPDIAEVLQMLQTTPECLLARMSGSGATCFGLFAGQAQADAAAAAIAAVHGQWWCKSAPLLSAS
ncbi:diphosphocytidyl-2-C-methylerythritol kinase [Magnetospirillum gryphiswaldense MSR-1 v2]|uniref:4-diphosphocytidyl-2-C-methyl-D-erythritol kinase n=1 Tax=Magnetospirillum gryphiswaldense (strain DSM 6361 / JCM 21280 / NBRC 15271 / MSR-1) TaxID=431944 RepID=V6F4C6_MAGGM|nr:4-(cytidine 5'-diphospho)-2-C-methyl-D-erythritol kinase [Magnetospirillum gryphiswaldense]CDL00247.1 diphosphocytidyl-2-C-methylerythritol kinase [Magnetospirillum gryphiswaldense MSR-1 v2]